MESNPRATPRAPEGRSALPDSGDVHPDDLPAWVEGLVARARRVADHYEVRAEMTERRKAAVDGGVLSGVNLSRTGGVCVKLHVDGATGFACSHDPDAAPVVVERALAMAHANARRGGRDFTWTPGTGSRIEYRPVVRRHPRDVAPEDSQALLQRASGAAREGDPDARVAALFGAQDRRVVFADSSGSWVDQEYLLSTLFVQAVHRRGSRLADGVSWRSGERGLDDFEEDGGPEAVGRDAARFAEEASRAERAPVGRMRVLCDNDLTGLLAHESFGHLTEFDLVSMGWSVLKGRLGESFAAENVSVVDAPEVPGALRDGVRVPFDEEGTRGRPLRILDRGVLENYMHLRGSATEEGAAPTGNGRAISVRHPPIVRMRNTFVEPGDLNMEEALELLGDGVYLIGGRGGAPASDGSFMFTSVRGYRVEGGEIREPIRSTSISGNVIDFLRGVEGLTSDFRVISSYFGGCGKWDQGLLHVGMGGPHVVVSGALVGGDLG